MSSSVRRIFERGGARKFRKFENNEEFFHPESVRFPAQNLVKTKKQSLHSNLVRFLAKNWVKAKKRHSPPFVCSNLLPKLQKGGGMPQFCILFNANYTILATQAGGHGPMPPPQKYAPGYE